MQTIGEKIKAARLALGMTQEEFSELAKIGRPNLARYETGKAEPSVSVLARIADATNKTVDYYLDRPSAQTPDDDDIKFALFGVDPANITDAQFEEVKRFARFVREQQAKGK